MKVFTENHIYESESSGKYPYWFECAMVSVCRPVFDRCDSNYEVERVLRDAKVIRKNNVTDTETCALIVLFSNKKSGVNFIQRLNKFLQR